MLRRAAVLKRICDRRRAQNAEKAVIGNFNKNIIPFTNGETKEVGH